MSIEKQNKNQYNHILVIDISNNDEFKEFRKAIKMQKADQRNDQKFSYLYHLNCKETLFFFKQTCTNGTTAYYSYDYFQYTKKLLTQLRRMDVSEDIEQLSKQEKNKEIGSPFAIIASMLICMLFSPIVRVGSGIFSHYFEQISQAKIKNSQEDISLKTSGLTTQAMVKPSIPSALVFSQNANAPSNDKDNDQLTAKAFLKAFRVA